MKAVLLSIFSLLLVHFQSFGQQDFPEIKLKDVSGKTVNFSQLAQNTKDTILVVSFWATWCIPCVTELDNVNEVYHEKQSIRPFKFIGVSIDDSRTTKRVKPFIKGKGWDFEVLLDVNSELKRAMNITDVPHVLIVKDGKIAYRHTGYIAGEEDNLFEEIKKL